MGKANGGFNTKQSIGIYGKNPPMIQWGDRNDSKIQGSILKKILPEPVEKANYKMQRSIETVSWKYDKGVGTIYIVMHNSTVS